MIELVVKVSGDDKTFSLSHLLLDETITLSHDDPILRSLVEKAVENFKGVPEDVAIRAKMVW